MENRGQTMALSLRASVRNRFAGIPSGFSIINDVLSKAKNDIGEPAYRTDDRSVSLRLLMIALNTTITRDTLGNITGANVIGGDGIARRIAITASNSRNGKHYLTTSVRAEFFENEQRYLFITTTIIPGAGRGSQS